MRETRRRSYARLVSRSGHRHRRLLRRAHVRLRDEVRGQRGGHRPRGRHRHAEPLAQGGAERQLGEGRLSEREGVWCGRGGEGGVCQLGWEEGRRRRGRGKGGGARGGGEVGGDRGGQEPSGGAGDQGDFELGVESGRRGGVEVYECVELGDAAEPGHGGGDDGEHEEEETYVCEVVISASARDLGGLLRWSGGVFAVGVFGEWEELGDTLCKI